MQVNSNQNKNNKVNDTVKSTNQNNTTTKVNSNNTSSNNKVNNSKTNSSIKNNATKTSDFKMEEWRIIIPSISLNAPISEGTSTDVMNKFVGHFENTDLWNGNVALAAHNRGYPVNYFANVKYLNKNEIIQYYYNGKVRQYKIETVTVITDTDWTYLKSTKDNRITLITCVENEPEYRRCIQAIEI